ncbi:MAG: alpha/beta hydrolase [Pseudomonadota bacterium]
MQPAEHFAQLNGVQLHWLEWGEPQNPTVLCLHGSWGTADSFSEFAATASRKFHVIAPDLRGHGESDWTPGDYAPASYAADVHALREACAISRWHVVGLSLGGLVALAYATQDAPSISSLMLVDIAPSLNAETLAGLTATLPYPESFASLDEALGWASTDGLWPQGPALRRTLEHRLRERPDGRLTWKTDPEFMQPQARARWFGGEVDLWRPFAALTVPVRLLRAGNSPLVDDDIVARMQGANSGFTLQDVPGADHSIPISHPDAFNAAALRFLDSI